MILLRHLGSHGPFAIVRSHTNRRTSIFRTLFAKEGHRMVGRNTLPQTIPLFPFTVRHKLYSAGAHISRLGHIFVALSVLYLLGWLLRLLFLPKNMFPHTLDFYVCETKALTSNHSTRSPCGPSTSTAALAVVRMATQSLETTRYCHRLLGAF